MIHLCDSGFRWSGWVRMLRDRFISPASIAEIEQLGEWGGLYEPVCVGIRSAHPNLRATWVFGRKA
ncbi:MAG: hypothetical protein C0630_03855 [Sedimenticola selenatireducens]|uniref:Uncharacterized protein n=1 Tax=Sedimenticola selenatireducens TaxID=191960 RepID=A0A2N6CZC1_9GAMM|nr:MAG: hypothetical protein C0630_03855 [Sedimenticola selenatireducens]